MSPEAMLMELEAVLDAYRTWERCERSHADGDPCYEAAEKASLAFQNAAENFVIGNGPALAEVVRDAERMNWVENQAHCLDWQDGEPVRRVVRAEDGAEFHSPNSWREAIDAARGKEVPDVGS